LRILPGHSSIQDALPSPLSSGRRRAELERRRDWQLLEILLSQLEIPVIACSADGRLTHASRGARALIGAVCSPGAPAEAWIEHLRPRTPEGLPLAVGDLPLMRAIDEAAARTFDMRIETARGELLVTASAHPLGADCSGVAMGAVVTLSDPDAPGIGAPGLAGAAAGVAGAWAFDPQGAEAVDPDDEPAGGECQDPRRAPCEGGITS